MAHSTIIRTMKPEAGQESVMVHDVFGIGELFEAILLELEPRDLLLSQSTSRYWKSFIEASPALQAKLFFRGRTTNEPPQLNTLLQRIFPTFFDLSEKESHHSFNRLTDLCNLNWYQDEQTRSKILHKDASWRRMFPIQPPAKLNSIIVYSWENCVYEVDISHARLGAAYQHLQSQGLTMGLLYDLVRFLVDWRPYGAFVVQWHMLPMAEVLRPDSYGRDPCPVFSTDPDFPSMITLHYHHFEFCGGYTVTPSGMAVEECGEDIVEMVEGEEDVVPGFSSNPPPAT